MSPPILFFWESPPILEMFFFLDFFDGESTPSVQKKLNLGGNVTPPRTTNLDYPLSRFIVLGRVTIPSRLSFFLTEGETLFLQLSLVHRYTYGSYGPGPHKLLTAPLLLCCVGSSSSRWEVRRLLHIQPNPLPATIKPSSAFRLLPPPPPLPSPLLQT